MNRRIFEYMRVYLEKVVFYVNYFDTVSLTNIFIKLKTFVGNSPEQDKKHEIVNFDVNKRYSSKKFVTFLEAVLIIASEL